MFKTVIDAAYFLDEDTLFFIDESFDITDPVSGEMRNVGALAEQLAKTIDIVADGVPLTSVEQLCTAIRAFVSLVEQCAYMDGAIAQRDGREVVRSRTAEEKQWNSVAIDDNDFDREAFDMRNHSVSTRGQCEGINYNCVFSGGKLIRANTLDHSVSEVWEQLTHFDDMAEMLFEFWLDNRRKKACTDDIWKNVGLNTSFGPPLFDLPGDTQQENADSAFTSGHDDHGRPLVWRRIQRGGQDPSPLVCIYCTVPDEHGNREAKVFWLPDWVETCGMHNELMNLVRESLRELGAIETLHAGLRTF